MQCKIVALIAAFGVAGCARTGRGPELYRNDTQKLLETRAPRLKSCYDEALKGDPKTAGTVTVRFVVQKETGDVANATIDPAKSNAPEPLVLCLLDAVNGLKLEPADLNEGQASFTYVFAPTTPPT